MFEYAATGDQSRSGEIAIGLQARDGLSVPGLSPVRFLSGTDYKSVLLANPSYGFYLRARLTSGPRKPDNLGRGSSI